MEDVHQLTGQHIRIPCILHLDLAEHLADDHLDVFVGDLHALEPIYALDFLEHVSLHPLDALDLQDVIGVDGAVGELVARLDHVPIPNPQLGAEGDQVLGGLPFLVGDGGLPLLSLGEGHGAVNLGDHRQALGLTGLEDFHHTGKALGNIVRTGHAAGVEGTHGKLGARLADGLGRDDAHCLADVHRAAGGQVGAIALGAYAALAAAGKYAAALDGLDPCGDDLIPYVIGDQLVAADDQLTGIGVVHVLCGIPAQQPVAQGLHHVVAIQDGGDGHALGAFAPALAAVLLPDDHVLRYVHQTAGQIARVRRT